MADRSITLSLKADVNGFVNGMRTAKTAASDMASQSDRTAATSQAAAKKIARASDDVARAQDRAKDAAGRLRVAEEQLKAARQGTNTTAIVRAEENLAKAQRDVDATARQAAAAYTSLGDAMDKPATKAGVLSEAVKNHAGDLQTLGESFALAGAGFVTAAGGAAKAAVDWESAWAGVTKTVDGTPEQYAQLEEELRGLATTLPATHAEIAAVAEAAGQLGVAREDITGFTRTMVDLGETTNLTADEAATQIAQISNVMGTMERDGSAGVERFASTLVALGNAGASTEAEILAMAQRIAGAGATVGATESDVLALSNTLASMGVNAELGGGTAQRFLLKMRTAVDEGGDSLEAFADAAGVSADEFSAKFSSSPVEALGMVAAGIDGVNQAGGNVTATLKELGIKGTEETQVMLALASSGDLLTDSLNLGADAWKQNTALADEANKRYETAASKIQVAWNVIKDAAIETGGAILPMVADLAEGVADLVSGFNELPDPVKSGLGVVAAIGGAALTAAGGFLMLAPRVVEAKEAFQNLKGGMATARADLDGVGAAADRNSGKVGKMASALGKLAGAAAVGVTIGSFVPSGATAEADALAAAITNIGTGGEQAAIGVDQLNAAFTGKGNGFDGLDVSGIEHAFQVMENPDAAQNLDNVLSKVLTLGTRGSSDVEFARKNFEALDGQLATMVNGGSVDEAAASFAEVQAAAERAGVPTERLSEIFPSYTAALQNADAQQAAAAGSAEQLGAAMENAAPSAEEVALSLAQTAGINPDGIAGIGEAMAIIADDSKEADEKLDGVLEALTRMGIIETNAMQAAAGFEEALDSMTASLAENGATHDIATEAGRANQDALVALRDAGYQLVEANVHAGESQGVLRDNLMRTYENLVASAEQMGYTSAEAEDLARKVMGIPPGVDITTAMDQEARVMAELTGEAIDAIPGYKGVTVAVSEDGTAGSVQARIDEITGTTKHVFVTDDGTSITVQEQIRSIDGVSRTVWVDDQGTVYGTQEDINRIQGKTVDLTAVARAATAEEALNWTARSRTSTVYARYDPASWNSPPTKNYVMKRSSGSGVPGLEAGGVASLPGYSSGGRLPRTGLGTDMILGVTSAGMPIARVDDGEWIINARSSAKHGPLLAAINRDDPRLAALPAFATGGRAGSPPSAPAGSYMPGWAAATFILQLDQARQALAAFTIALGLAAKTATSTSTRSRDGARTTSGRSRAGGAGVASISRRSAWDPDKGNTHGRAGLGSLDRYDANTRKWAQTIQSERTRAAKAGWNMVPSEYVLGDPRKKGQDWSAQGRRWMKEMARRYGPIYSGAVHEDWSGRLFFKDGRQVEVDSGGAWRWVTSKKKRQERAWNGQLLRDYYPRFARGGRLPYTGLGTDRILGVAGDGAPRAWLDDGEFVTNEKSTRKYLPWLEAINADSPAVRHLARLSDGGLAGQHWPAAPAFAPQIAAPAADPGVIAQAVHAGIAQAIPAAMAGWQPVVQIGTREFKGLMVAANNHTRGR